MNGASHILQPGTAHSKAGELNPCVLLVDDDPGILQSVGLLLAYLGHTPVFAATGEVALAKLEAGLMPILVILDIDMPGLGGAGTLPLLRTLRPDLPVVIATGRPCQKVVELTRCFTQVSLMPKPYGLQELRALLA